MKALIVLSLSLIATAAMATDVQVRLNGESVQLTSVAYSSVTNDGKDGGRALQNLASNSGNVTIDNDSLQIVSARDSAIRNQASGRDAVATQNLASNYGKVNVNQAQVQLVAARGSYIGNLATGHSHSVQNISSNNGCTACQ